jgi:Kef-type K+ transport system membrane component KefB
MAELAVAVLAIIVGARVLGAVARRLGQPAVVGELVAGIVLGPGVLGVLAPSAALDVVGTIAASGFLLAAGLEVRLSSLRSEVRSSVAVGLGGIAFPLALGFAAAKFAPASLALEGSDATGGAMFVGIALSISALPVIVRTLMDLRLHGTGFGTAVLAAAMFDDLVGWLLFALLLGRFQAGLPGAWNPWATVAAELVLAVLMVTVVRVAMNRMLAGAGPRFGPTGAVLAAVLLACAAGAWAGFSGGSVLFGALLAGVAVGDGAHVPKASRSFLASAAGLVFGPLFFGMMGLKVDFVRHFDLRLCLLVLALACVAKVVGCWAGARLVGIPGRRALAFGFAMNSRGAMGIVLGLAALEAGIIGPRLLVALVAMAVITSVMAGPCIRMALRGAGEEGGDAPGAEGAPRRGPG